MSEAYPSSNILKDFSTRLKTYVIRSYYQNNSLEPFLKAVNEKLREKDLPLMSGDRLKQLIQGEEPPTPDEFAALEHAVRTDPKIAIGKLETEHSEITSADTLDKFSELGKQLLRTPLPLEETEAPQPTQSEQPKTGNKKRSAKENFELEAALLPENEELDIVLKDWRTETSKKLSAAFTKDDFIIRLTSDYHDVVRPNLASEETVTGIARETDKYREALKKTVTNIDRQTFLYPTDESFLTTYKKLCEKSGETNLSANYHEKHAPATAEDLLSHIGAEGITHNQAAILGVMLGLAPKDYMHFKEAASDDYKRKHPDKNWTEPKHLAYVQLRELWETEMGMPQSAIMRAWHEPTPEIPTDTPNDIAQKPTTPPTQESGAVRLEQDVPPASVGSTPITISFKADQSFASCLDHYVDAGKKDVREFLKLYMQAHDLDVMKFRDEINGAQGSNELIHRDVIANWVRERRPLKINEECRAVLTERYGLNQNQQKKLEFLNHNPLNKNSRTLDEPKDIIDKAMQALAEENADRKKIAVETYIALIAATGLTPEALSKDINNEITPTTLRGWINKRPIEYDTLAPAVDRMVDILIPDNEPLAEQAASILMGQPWPTPQNFDERMAYAIEHKQSVSELLDSFRYQERKQIYTTPKEDTTKAFCNFLSKGRPADQLITPEQFHRFKKRQDVPNTEIINHVAQRIGASTPEQMAQFRKLAYEYPMSAGQAQVDDALTALENAGEDKTQRKAAFVQFEHALKQRDGFRPKGYRKELSEAIYKHADAHALLPPDSGITHTTIGETLASLTNGGGETNVVRAPIIAAYAFQEDEDKRTRCKNALAPHSLEAAPGGNLFQSGEKQFRPNWTYQSPPRRSKGDKKPPDGPAGLG